jgi:hypothetical protein
MDVGPVKRYAHFDVRDGLPRYTIGKRPRKLIYNIESYA